MRAHLIRRPQWWLAALACAGVALTHEVSYRLIAGEDRAALLHDTGHGAWPHRLPLIVVGLAVVGLAGSVLERRSVVTRATFITTATRLGAVQGGVWTAVELAERVTSGHSHLSWRSTAPVAIGLGVQVAVAFIGAAVLVLVGEVAELVRSRPGRQLASPKPATGGKRRYAPSAHPRWAPATPRGPPVR